MIVVVSCLLPLGIFLSYPLGVLGGPPTFSPSLGTIIRVHMGVGYRGQGLIFRVFHLQLSCKGLKSILFLGACNIPKSLCCPLAPSSTSAELSGDPDVSVPSSSPSVLCIY